MTTRADERTKTKSHITFQIVASKGSWAQAVLIPMEDLSVYKRRLHAAKYLDLGRRYIAKSSQRIYLYRVRHSVEGRLEKRVGGQRITQRNPFSTYDEPKLQETPIW